MLTPVGEHELLLFWVQLAVLLATARGLGALAQRVGQPPVVGELAAGLVLGPSILGRLAPGLAQRLFPGGEIESALVLAIAWLGIVLLLAVTGFETDLRLLRRLGRQSAGVALGSLIVPLALGLALGLVMPDTYVGDGAGRTIFAMFIAVALSISALPVVAKILQDMRLMRRNFGQITVAAGMVNDLVGWLLLGVLIGVVHTGGFEPRPLAVAITGITVFVALAMTAGQRVVDAGLRRARRGGNGFAGSFTVTILVVLVSGAITHAIGMEAVIGAFVAGVVLGRSRFLPRDVQHAIEHMSTTTFAPIFFATAGLYVDLGTLASWRNASAAVAVLAVAAVAKLGGSYVGGRISRLSPMESLAAGIGLNARGAMEIVLAAIGLRLAVLNESSYTAVVLMAMVTSMAAPPLLRPVLRRMQATPEEAERLEREELLAASIIANARHALLPTRGGDNSVVAGRMLDLVLQPDAHVTVFTVDHPDEDEAEMARRRARAATVRDRFGERPVDARRVVSRDGAAAAILEEAGLGYDLLAVGLNEGFRGTHELSGELQQLLAGTRIPVLLVRRSSPRPSAGGGPDDLARILVPVTGTLIGRAAEEIAYVLASNVDATVDALHVVSRIDRRGTRRLAAHQLRRARTLAERFGGAASAQARAGPVAYEEILAAANERDVDLIVLGAQVRSHDGRPFLGHGTEYLLEHAHPPVAVVVFPAEPS
ncbi:MAG: cation:proton antiporter [Actinobacteria bacterium]|nr:cation:proton antiporter [Actinomycetota bacterium]